MLLGCLPASHRFDEGLQEAEWLYGIPAADALAHPERVLERGGSRWQGVLVSGGRRGRGAHFPVGCGRQSLLEPQCPLQSFTLQTIDMHVCLPCM